MIGVVIIGVLTTIAMPTYQEYIRRSRSAEAESNVSSLAQYEEQYYSEHSQYYLTQPNPDRIPSSIDSGGALPFNATEATWAELGAVFGNTTNVRFQYRIGAGKFNASGGNKVGTGLIAYTVNMIPLNANLTTTGNGNACAFNPATRSAQDFGVTPVPNGSWFVIMAIGNQNLKGASATVCSMFVKMNDRPTIYKENDTE